MSINGFDVNGTVHKYNYRALDNISVVRSDLSDEVAKELDYSDLQLGTFEGNSICKPYEYRMFCHLRTTSAVLEYEETYAPSSSRAVQKINSDLIDGSVFIYNPDKYVIGVYYRRKSNNEYVGYAVDPDQYGFASFQPDTTTYEYYVIAINRVNGVEINWSQGGLDAVNRRLFIYSGDHYDIGDFIPTTIESNLVSMDIVHIGKYYYGGTSLFDNAEMAYTDLIPVKEYHKYYVPYITLGWSWYSSDQVNVLGGDYISVEGAARQAPYFELTAPAGASYIGISCRTGDVYNLILSELPNSKATIEESSILSVVGSKVIREPLNWIINTDFEQNRSGSRLTTSGSVTFDGSKMVLAPTGFITCNDQITMDKSKVDIVFSLQNNSTSSFVLGCNGYYAVPSLAISDGAIAVWFRDNGTTAEVRSGTGQDGVYATLLSTLDITVLNISSGRKFVLSIEKDTINKYVVSIYDAMTPNSVVSTTIQASANQQDQNLYNNQIRGWGGPYAICNSGGNVNIYKIQMYSTAPTYPHVAIWGDSYVENMGRAPDCAYGNLMREALNGNAFLSGQGGATAEQTSCRMANEINCCAPQYIILNVGVNDSFNVSVSTFKTQLGRLINMAELKGAEPILITIPRINDGAIDNSSWIQEVNPWIRSTGYRYIDIAYVLSTGDGITEDYSKMVSDKTHPNLSGGQAIFNYIKVFLPDLLWN